jgi:aspartate aminotransferase-like enzyme
MDIEKYRGFDEGFSYLCGISDLSPRALRYMMRPHMYTSSELMKYYDETLDMIKKLMHTKADLLAIPGPIRVVMDAAIASVVEPGDRVLLAANGYWGRYPKYMLKLYEGVPVIMMEREEAPIDPKSVEKGLKEGKNIKVVHVVHCETEAGILNPIDEIGEVVKDHGALYIVDSATAFPGNKLDADKWGIDIDYFGSHKGMNAPSGLSFISVSREAWDLIEKRKTPIRSWYTSLLTWRDVWMKARVPGTEHCITSFPTTTLHAVRAKLDYIYELGEERYLKKYEVASRAIRVGMKEMGLSPAESCDECPGCDSPNKFCSNTDFAVKFPPEVNGVEFGHLMGNRYRITVHHASFGPDTKYFLAENAFRPGTITDYQHIPRNILALLTSTGLAMTELGAKNMMIEKGVKAANEVLKEMDELKISYYME